MNINLNIIKVRDLVEGFEDKREEGVFGYDNKLTIRPPYQREFVYNEKQQCAVVDTMTKGLPLNVMYWVENEDGTYEVMDGQQRTLSICNYVANGFAFEDRFFCNLLPGDRDKLLDYELMVYICTEGTHTEKMKWFETINIAGERLTTQELRNATYAGLFVTDARADFSKPNCRAKQVGFKYMKGTAIRQDYLETALKWISNKNINNYMAIHQHDTDAVALWEYFDKVIRWTKAMFPTYRKEMKGVDWGFLYNEFGNTFNDYESEVAKLMADEDVTKKKGIYTYVLTRDPRHLSIRAFDKRMKREVYETQNGICPACGEKHEIEGMEADHITPWSEGGTTTVDNCQMLCKKCNRTKSNK